MLEPMEHPWLSEKFSSIEADFNSELTELKQEIEDNVAIHGIMRPVSSVPLPKDMSHFRTERELRIKRVLEVYDAQPLIAQADVMKEELDSTLRAEYTPDNLPLLLHQYFNDRMEQLVQCKHMHMLRWKRFCEHTSTIETLYPHYNSRLGHIMSEYSDCISRAQRLSVARVALLTKKTAVQTIDLEDMFIYLRFLVCHLHSVSRFNQFLKVVEWLPVTHKEDIRPEQHDDIVEEMCDITRIPARYQDEDTSFIDNPVFIMEEPAIIQGPLLTNEVPHPPPLDPTLLSSDSLSPAQLHYAAAAAGGGIASNESTLELPLQSNEMERFLPLLNFFAHLYMINLNVEELITSSNEMELYAAVNRKFRQVYLRQEHLNTFKTYDRIEVGQDNWGADHSTHALRQECNWLPYIRIFPHREPMWERKIGELRKRNELDELLLAQSKFMHVADAVRVQIALQDHALMVRDPPTIYPVSVTSNPTAHRTTEIWKMIYSNPDLYATNEDKGDKSSMEEMNGKKSQKGKFNQMRTSITRKRKDSYDYFDTVKLLGLNESDPDNLDTTSIQGGYLSFLQLRHLRIRDLKRTCLSILNYFRSIERTLTINDGGLSLESGKVIKSGQSHRNTVGDGTMGTGGALGSHQYIHNTPNDYKQCESEFMEFADIDNHDDYYLTDEGRVHVQDQRGYYVMYDAALEDLQKLDNDLLLIGSYYLSHDKVNESLQKSDFTGMKSQQATNQVNIPAYGHQGIDRFAVLLDLWTSEAAFQECKKELLDCYMEVYQHVFDKAEKRRLAQVMTDIMFLRPRLDFTSTYFLRSYRLECVILRQKSQLVKALIDAQIEEQREYTRKVCREGDGEFGLPHMLIAKQPISVNLHRSALRNVYMLEFHPSLAFASRLLEAIEHSLKELSYIHNPETVLDTLVLEKKLMEYCQMSWDNLPDAGTSFSKQVQKDLFAGVYIEDPLFITEVAHALVVKVDGGQGMSRTKEKHVEVVKTICNLLEILTSRHRLIDASWETEILSKVYKRHAKEMGYDICHLFLPHIQFEIATFKYNAGSPPPVFIYSIQEDDIAVNRFVPKCLHMAIHEIESGHIGRFSFHSRGGLLQIFKDSGLENLQVALALQVIHKNGLISAVTLSDACQFTDIEDKFCQSSIRSSTSSGMRMSRNSLLAGSIVSNRSSTMMSTVLLTKVGRKLIRTPYAFLSLQLEKIPSRDLLLNDFINKKKAMGNKLMIPEEAGRVKRKLIITFAYHLNRRLAQFSLRGQIIKYYISILRLLENAPKIRELHFMLGSASEKKTPHDTISGLEPDPRRMRLVQRLESFTNNSVLFYSKPVLAYTRQLRRRPRRVLSEDGDLVLNVWFIPHHTEVLIIYKHLEDEACRVALHYHLRIISALHDIIQYLCAHSHVGSKHGTEVSASWGGAEGISTDLSYIQKQIDHLDDRTDPEQVATFLIGRRDVMFLEFDTAVRHCMCDAFLATNNATAFKTITECMHFPLHFMGNTQRQALNSLYLPVPEPLEAHDPAAEAAYPWRSFINKYGPFPVHCWQWFLIEGYLQLCLVGLKEVDRQVANGSLLGVSLMMEEVLNMGEHDRALGLELSQDSDDNVSPSKCPSKVGSTMLDIHTQSSPIYLRSGSVTTFSRTSKPIAAYKLLKNFLLLWKRLEILKKDWGCQRLNVPAIDSPSRYIAFCKEYKKSVLFPVILSAARRYGQSDKYEGLILDEAPIVTPNGASETEIKTKQLWKLLDALECNMVAEVRKRIARELNGVMTERVCEESALPTDLWKRPSIKQCFTINKPHIAEDLIANAMSKAVTTDTTVTFPREHLEKCFSLLATHIMTREKQTFEAYSMYYENHMRSQHQLLYNHQQEEKKLKGKLLAAQMNLAVDVQCQLADHTQGLLLEVTALRAKVKEMGQKTSIRDQDVRNLIREEYQALINNLFACSFDLKKKFDEHRESLSKDVLKKIEQTRIRAAEEMASVQYKSGSMKDEESARVSRHAAKIHAIRCENSELYKTISKMKVLNMWQRTHHNIVNKKKKTELTHVADVSTIHFVEMEMISKEKTILLEEQLSAMQKALRLSESQAMKTKKLLEREMKAKKDDSHAEQQKFKSQRQIDETRKENLDRMTGELETTDQKLRVLSAAHDKVCKQNQEMDEKIKKEGSTFKQQLTHERSLKINAFHRVDDLQTQIYDMETTVRPHTAAGVRTNENQIKPAQRPKTATGTHLRTRFTSPKSQCGPLTGGVWPPHVLWPPNRSPSPATEQLISDRKSMQRPRTTLGRLRNRIAEQLLNNLDPPDHQETLIRIRDLDG